MSEPRFHPAARIDYAVARRWYADRSARAAEQFEAGVDAALNRIAVAPNQHPLIDDRHRCVLLRRFPYYVVYRTDAEGVLVIAVAHAKRAADYWAACG